MAPVPNKPTVSVDVEQNSTKGTDFRVQELCESRDDRPGLPVPNKPCGLRGRKATMNKRKGTLTQTRYLSLRIRFTWSGMWGDFVTTA